ncbi:TnsD family Tn7-like transposition protein [Paenibacillus zanthoxyli]|uniref:TnsD family Tn7-like transposition protein n=1 Tax=Paenibacillus zanthoxyli TaxID=369399 RepID=UPI0004722302|nr:TnsD family Tn7-like transposition protein [Paenibacillus zanthoxyli]
MDMYGGMPLPYPDELLYSMITRYHLRMNNSSPKWTFRELFGTDNVIPTLDLPSHLDNLSPRSQIIGITSDQWIDEHTLYSYYAPFLPENRSKQLKQMMRSNDGSGIHTLVGITASSMERNGELRFCPSCYEEDIKRFGEPYWHRVHQAAGVMFCPEHHIVLHRITHPVSDRHGLTVLPIARHLFQSQPLVLTVPERAHLRLLGIAQDIQLLLSVGHSLNLYNSRDSLLHKLSEQGCLTPANRIRQRELEMKLISYYGKEMLELLNCMTYGNDYSWLAVATRKARRAVHPLRQLLLISFLFGSFGRFLEQKNMTYSQFGEGPWPCLNKAADHYKESLIQNVQITRCSDTGRPVGTFTCGCGFSYSRRGPDQRPEDRYRIGRIKTFGPVWKNQLMVYMENGLSYRSAAEKLGVDTNTVIKYVRLDPANESVCHEVILRSSRTVKTKVPSKKRNARHVRVDWKKRDLELSWEVEEACNKLIDDRKIKPIRITFASIGKRIGKLALLEKHKDKLPVTMAILSNHLETVDQFQIRRIQWTAEQMHDEFPIKRWKLIRKAGIRPGYSNAVSEALNYYSGHGLHSLNFADGVMTQWLQ